MNNKKLLQRCINSLKRAEKMAFENRDAEMLVAISDRWYALIDQYDEKPKKQHRLGFTIQEESNDSQQAKH